MNKRPFLLASMLIGGIFLFFILVVFTAGYFRTGTLISTSTNQVGVLEITGMIANDRLVVSQIDAFRENDSVKAVVLRVNSPGGAVAPSQEIYAELLRLAQEKPLIVSFGTVAASGGYYIAMAGERIFANPGTITGSIGVVMSFPDYQELMGKVGIKTVVIKSGSFKDVGSAMRDMTDAERQLLSDMLFDVHSQFVEVVSKGRNLAMDDLLPYVDGRIFTGRQALEIGLVDEMGGFNDAVAYAADRAGLKGRPNLVFPPPERKNLLQRYLNIIVERYIGVDFGFQSSIGPQYLWSGP